MMIRNYRSEDLKYLLKLTDQTEMQSDSGDSVSKGQLLEYIDHPGACPTKDMFVAESDGNLCGFISVFAEPGIGRALLNCLVLPAHRRQGIGTALSDCALKRAAQSGVNVVQVNISESNAVAKKRLTSMNFQFIRNFFELQADIYKKCLPIVKSAEYVIRPMRQGEEKALTLLQNRCFAGSWGFNPNTINEIIYRLNLEGCCHQDVQMAFRRDMPVAYCWTRANKTVKKIGAEKKANIHMMGVHPDYRSRGIGKQTLLACLADLEGKGCHVVELTVDANNRAGLALYKSLGFKVLETTEWYEKRV